MNSKVAEYFADDTVLGWFSPDDFLLFDALLGDQERNGVSGNLGEIGVFQGRSAILLGYHKQPDELVCVCDVFDSSMPDALNRADYERWYSGREPTRALFEENYRRFHGRLPDVIVEASSDEFVHHAPVDSFRFIHIDGSHLYRVVAGDIDRCRELLAPGGLLVCDDYRTEHSPGTAAAVWEAVFNKGLRVICVTAQKFYATWSGDVDSIQDRLRAWVPEVESLGVHSEPLDRWGTLLHLYRQGVLEAATALPGSRESQGSRSALHRLQGRWRGTKT